MTNYYWNDWYTGWGWVLWFGMVFLFFSMMGNWGYTYRAHRRFGDYSRGESAFDILHKRYASGELSRDEFLRMKEEIANSIAVNQTLSNNATNPDASGASKFSQPLNPSLGGT